MKSTMNSRDIAKFHKLLAKDVPSAGIVKILQIDLDTLKRFTPEKVAAAKDLAVKATQEAAAKRKKTQELASAAMLAARSAIDG